MEELIHKQTREIQTLKSDLITEKETSSLKLKETESKCSTKINEIANKLNDAELIKSQAIRTSNELSEQLKKENENLNQKFAGQINSLISEKKSLTESHEKDLNELKNTIEQLKLKSTKEKESNDLKIQDLNEENRKYLTELQSLRAYINESMPTINTVKEINKEKDQLIDELNKIRNKNDSLLKENSALQVRLKSINEILIIQEAQLESKVNATTSGSSSSSSSSTGLTHTEKKKQGLLNKWRNKVFELLIQLKSLEINSKLDSSSNDKMMREYNLRLEESKDKNKILENLIEDKKAELYVVQSQNLNLTQELSQLKEDHQDLVKKNSQDLQSSIELKKFVDELFKQYQSIEDSFKLANRKLSHLDQRVEFAKNRLGVIKALYKRKNYNDNRNVLEMTENLSSIHGSLVNNNNNESNINQPPTSSIDPNKQHDNADLMILKQELDKVVNERDLLANRLETDLMGADEKLDRLKNEHELQISVLNNHVKELHDLNEINAEKCEQLNEQLLSKVQLNQELSQKYEIAKTEFELIKEKLKESFDAELKKIDSEFADKLSKMDQNLNEARREQAKAVVLMRQMERTTNREKSRLENLLQSTETYYKDFIEKLKAKIASLEKEKNILMNSLRQQGKLSESLALKNRSNVEKQRFEITGLRSELNSSESQLQINKWIGNNESIQELSNRNRLLTNMDKISDLSEDNTNATSFWLDSKEKIEDKSEEINESNNNNNEEDEDVAEEEEEEEGGGEEEETGNDDLDTSDPNKNLEILQQIRKIMGNLELSDIDDEVDNENNYSGFEFYLNYF